MRDQYFRSSRRRDFDADSDTYRPQTRVFRIATPVQPSTFRSPIGPNSPWVVKWFSPDKGFGFIELSDGSGDAFLHGSVLAQSGYGVVQPGETLEFRVGPGHKGPHVTEVLSVDASTAISAPRRSSFPQATLSTASDVEQTGTVKWFNAEKGYGFITLADGEKDIFVHVSAFERSGLTGLAEGQQVVVDIGEGRKGPEATRVRLA